MEGFLLTGLSRLFYHHHLILLIGFWSTVFCYKRWVFVDQQTYVSGVSGRLESRNG